MADLTDIQAASPVKLVGSDASGVEQTPIQSTANGGLHVNLRDASGNEITSFGGGGGGTQYADGAARGTATGNLVMGDDGTNIQAITAKLLNVQLDATDTGLVVNSVLHGLTTGGGGGYVDVKVNPSGALTTEAVVVSSALPSGAATAANQATEIASLASIDSKTPALVSGRQPVDGSGVTQPISAASLPLPTGAATETTLASINTKIPALGQTVMASSQPVVIASNQTAVPISATSLPLPTGASTLAEQQSQTALLSSISANTISPLSTYSASASFTAGNNATDIFTIAGSATKTVKVRKITVSATQTTASIVNLILLRRSTANSNNATTAVTAVTHDTTNAAATASVVFRTGNPGSAGTLVGNIRYDKILIGTATATTLPDRITWDFTNTVDQALVLRGTAQNLNINLNGVTITGNNFDISIEWTEE